MIKVSTRDPVFNQAWCNAWRALPVAALESPRQYGQRWREEFKCRVEYKSDIWPDTCYVFDRDEDYTWFMMRWS